MTNQPNARFWDYAHDGAVKITLRPGQTLSHQEGGRNDEGHEIRYATWEYEDGVITCAMGRYGCDCDGRYEDGSEYVTTLASTKINTPKGRQPVWKDKDSFQRDYAAEAMGY